MRCLTGSALQATIQGALGSLPLLLINSSSQLKSRSNYPEYVSWGNDILHSTAFSIIIAAPVGLLCIALLGPVLLTKVGTRPCQRAAPASPRCAPILAAC